MRLVGESDAHHVPPELEPVCRLHPRTDPHAPPETPKQEPAGTNGAAASSGELLRANQAQRRSRTPSLSRPGTAAARSSRPRPGSAVGGRSTAPEPGAGGDGGGAVSGEGGVSRHRERRWRRRTPPHAVIADTHRRRGEERRGEGNGWEKCGG
ncbi:hypothetical protein DAI22_07g151500 [Oryza sativa Japonica Group]|nr:hypothetical protein DAI22_07g151500 [Oryza sativa Japonica Group]